MATGDGEFKRGSYATVQASASVTGGNVSGGAVTDIETALPTEQNNFYLDFQVVVTGTPNAGQFVTIYKRPSDGTTAAPAPSASHNQVYVGSVVMTNQANQAYYLRGVINDDPKDTYYIQNGSGGATLTLELKARGRTAGTEA